MPQVAFAFLADFVRADGGIGHAIAIGIDTVFAPNVPTGQNLGFMAQIEFSPAELGRPHRIEVFAMGEDGDRLVAMNAVTPRAQAGPALTGRSVSLPVGGRAKSAYVTRTRTMSLPWRGANPHGI